VSLLGKSFSNIEGSVRYLAPELALTEVFADEMRGILIHLARESLSEVQAARTARDLMIGNTLAPEQLRGLVRDLANRDFTVRVGNLRGKGTGRGDAGAANGLPIAAITMCAGALLWWAGRRVAGPAWPAHRCGGDR
jgi:ubiquinone biosynthesis protein